MFHNFTRFSQFQKSLGIATNVLARRLEGFVEAGLMERRQAGASGEQAEYRLTQKGLELKPVIIALTEWGDKWCSPARSSSRTNPTASLSRFNGAERRRIRGRKTISSPFLDFRSLSYWPVNPPRFQGRESGEPHPKPAQQETRVA